MVLIWVTFYDLIVTFLMRSHQVVVFISQTAFSCALITLSYQISGIFQAFQKVKLVTEAFVCMSYKEQYCAGHSVLSSL